MKKFEPLLLEEISNSGFTHRCRITADDLTTAATNTAQALTLPTIPAGFIISRALAVLVTPFQDASDAAYNTTTFTLGDAGSANRLITSQELNLNGTEITIPAFGNTAYEYTADTALLATFGSQSGKSLSNIDVGELDIYVQIFDTKLLSRLGGKVDVVKVS